MECTQRVPSDLVSITCPSSISSFMILWEQLLIFFNSFSYQAHAGRLTHCVNGTLSQQGNFMAGIPPRRRKQDDIFRASLPSYFMALDHSCPRHGNEKLNEEPAIWDNETHPELIKTFMPKIMLPRPPDGLILTKLCIIPDLWKLGFRIWNPQCQPIWTPSRRDRL